MMSFRRAPHAGRHCRIGPVLPALPLLSAVAGALLFAAEPVAAASSPWVSELGARARLIASDSSAGEALRAGLEIDLEDGFKTYWRVPGASGVPPMFDFSRSRNVEEVTVAFPAPKRLAEGAGDAIGYTDEVVFPLRVMPADPERPVRLVANAVFGACEEICVPVSVELALDLQPGARFDPEVEVTLAAFEGRVPVPVGEAGPRVTSVTVAAGERPELTVRVSAPGKAGDIDLFAEAPQGWYLTVPRRIAAEGDAALFSVAVVERPAGARTAQLPLRFTIVGAGRAVEQVWHLD